jgi:hypothetical protein
LSLVQVDANMRSEVPASALGAVIACPHCGGRVKLNPFTINADWRPIAAAWKTTANDGSDGE